METQRGSARAAPAEVPSALRRSDSEDIRRGDTLSSCKSCPYAPLRRTPESSPEYEPQSSPEYEPPPARTPSPPRVLTATTSIPRRKRGYAVTDNNRSNPSRVEDAEKRVRYQKTPTPATRRRQLDSLEEDDQEEYLNRRRLPPTNR